MTQRIVPHYRRILGWTGMADRNSKAVIVVTRAPIIGPMRLAATLLQLAPREQSVGLRE
jgi:hypothetical protein